MTAPPTYREALDAIDDAYRLLRADVVTRADAERVTARLADVLARDDAADRTVPPAEPIRPTHARAQRNGHARPLH